MGYPVQSQSPREMIPQLQQRGLCYAIGVVVTFQDGHRTRHRSCSNWFSRHEECKRDQVMKGRVKVSAASDGAI